MQSTIRVYQLADTLGIESLKLVTTRKIIDMIATTLDDKLLESVLETLFSTVPDSPLRYGTVDACVHNYNRVMLLPKAVALLEAHEARIWRLARQNYTTHIAKIKHCVQETIWSATKKTWWRCLGNRRGVPCEAYITRDMIDITNGRPWVNMDENELVSLYVTCEDCDTESSFVVGR